MKIQGIIWLEDIIDKIMGKHRVQPLEVEQVLSHKPLFHFVEKGYIFGEDIYAALGRTRAGRYLTVFFVYKENHHALIVSARDMSKAERKRYEQK